MWESWSRSRLGKPPSEASGWELREPNEREEERRPEAEELSAEDEEPLLLAIALAEEDDVVSFAFPLLVPRCASRFSGQARAEIKRGLQRTAYGLIEGSSSSSSPHSAAVYHSREIRTGYVSNHASAASPPIATSGHSPDGRREACSLALCPI